MKLAEIGELQTISKRFITGLENLKRQLVNELVSEITSLENLRQLVNQRMSCKTKNPKHKSLLEQKRY